MVVAIGALGPVGLQSLVPLTILMALFFTAIKVVIATRLDGALILLAVAVVAPRLLDQMPTAWLVAMVEKD